MIEPLSIEIRPGVERPDWSLVTSVAAREALGSRDASRPDLVGTWATGLTAHQDLVWRKTLELFVRLGRSPLLTEIARASDLEDEKVLALARELEERDLAGLNEAATGIAYAYPLTAQRTEHRVTLAGHRLCAPCAVDALGVGAMYGADTVIESTCRQCQANITVRTAHRGTEIADAHPSTMMIWYDTNYDRKAATSCCPSIAFFCSLQHLREWHASPGVQRTGYELMLVDAFQVARALFGPLLRAPTLNLGTWNATA